MVKAKSIILLFLFITTLSELSASSKATSPKIRSKTRHLKNHIDSINRRSLLSAPNSWIANTAVIYSEPNFGGTPSTIVSGQPQYQYTKYVSFEVGASATLRIVDYENEYVYRFEAGRIEKRFEIDSSDWEATVDHPVPTENEECVLIFQYANFHGYFQKLCVDQYDGEFNAHNIVGSYASITFPYSSMSLAIFVASDGESFLPVTENTSFQGDYSTLLLFDSIQNDSAILVDLNDNMAYYRSAGYGHIPPNNYNWDSFRPSRYILIAGYNTYAKAGGSVVSYVVSQQRPYRFFEIEETFNLYVKKIYDSSFNSNQARLYYDLEGFSLPTVVTYTGNSDTFSYMDFKYVELGEDIQGIWVNLSNGDIIIRGGPLPDLGSGHILEYALIPRIPDDQVYFWSDVGWQGNQYDLGLLDQNNQSFDDNDISSIIVGRNVRRFGFYMSTEPNTNYDNWNARYYPPGAYYSIYLNDGTYEGTTEIFDYLSDDVSENYCFDLWENYMMLTEFNYHSYCVDTPELLANVDLSQTKIIAIPVDRTYDSVLLFREPEHCEENVDQLPIELNIIATTIFTQAMNNIFTGLTIVPNVDDDQVFLYENSYFRGHRSILDNTNAFAYNINTNHVHYISGAFGYNTQIYVIDTTTPEVTRYEANFYSHNVYQKNIYVQYWSLDDEADLVNSQSGALWTFDDEDYSNMRVLQGKQFYDVINFSQEATTMVFPQDGSISRVIILDGVENFIYEFDDLELTQEIDPIGQRAIVLPNNWNSIILGEGVSFQKYLATLGASTMVRLDSSRTYSVVLPLNVGVTLYDMTQIGGRFWSESQVGTVDDSSVIYLDTFDTLFEDSLKVASTGYYAIAIDGVAPKSILLDCILIFDSCNWDYSNGIHKYCTNDNSYAAFTLPINAGSEIGVVVSQPIDGSKQYRSYSGVLVDGQFVEKTRCVTVSSSTVEVAFRR